MMSELAHQDTDIQTHNATQINFDNVIPMPRRSEETLSSENLQDSEAISLFISTLRHESRNKLRGDELAKYLDENLGKRESSDDQPLQSKLSQIVRETNADNDTYDARYDNDPVFKNIIDKLVSKGRTTNTTEQRAAARKLSDLRITLPTFKTSDDETWVDVTNRLMD